MAFIEWEKVRKLKKENQFFIPNYQLTFQEFLDIFTVFHSKERVNSFIKKLFLSGINFAKEYEKTLPSPIQITERNNSVFGVDYGFFLENLMDFIIQNGGIVDEEEQKKARVLLRIFFGINDENLKFNYPAQVLMKVLFGKIYGVTNYKNMELKGRVFYDYFVENGFGKVYKIHLFFVKKIALEKVFSDKKTLQNYEAEIAKFSSKLFTELKEESSEEIEDLFDYKEKV